MGIAKSNLTILFADPFWIGLYERACGGIYEVSQVTFGAEPKDHEVYAFFLKNWYRLKFSPSVPAAALTERKINPKRMQRQIRKRTEQTGVGTKAQHALKLQQEQKKTERKTHTREQKEVEKVRQYALRQEQKKQKHRGH